MKIIDKASWQIDGGIQPSVVTAHFKRIFSWLEAKGLLTQEGKEVLEIGIDDSVSLHERLVTPEALAFLDAKYNDYLIHNLYGEDEDSSALEAILADYKLTNKAPEDNKIINEIDFIGDTKVYHEA
ncbi:MAG: hypothetical protein FWH25_04705 [Syntrophorhabdaceae bacterium]|nr:hypothetical protein [Syntrophorhabdaceae bacterium]